MILSTLRWRGGSASVGRDVFGLVLSSGEGEPNKVAHMNVGAGEEEEEVFPAAEVGGRAGVVGVWIQDFVIRIQTDDCLRLSRSLKGSLVGPKTGRGVLTKRCNRAVVGCLVWLRGDSLCSL